MKEKFAAFVNSLTFEELLELTQTLDEIPTTTLNKIISEVVATWQFEEI